MDSFCHPECMTEFMEVVKLDLPSDAGGQGDEQSPVRRGGTCKTLVAAMLEWENSEIERASKVDLKWIEDQHKDRGQPSILGEKEKVKIYNSQYSQMQRDSE